tara:strand:+ start:236 stop:394 length:159 start_codon:yes stop_codon:yes gene_type:complete
MGCGFGGKNVTKVTFETKPVSSTAPNINIGNADFSPLTCAFHSAAGVNHKVV